MKNQKNPLAVAYNAVANALSRAYEEGPFTAVCNWAEGRPRKSQQQPKQQDSAPKN